MKEHRSTPPEKHIQTKILKYLRTLPECWAVKADVSQRGVPDIICCYRGRFIALEVKRPGGRITPAQQATLDVICRAGGAVSVVRSLDEVKHTFLLGAQDNEPASLV